jgi:Bacterial SH3 domain
MKKLFPNIETAIIFFFVVCIMLWGMSRCNKKKDDLSGKSAMESPSANFPPVDTTTSSPAARKAPAQQALPPMTPPSVPIQNDPNQGIATAPQYPSVPMPSAGQPVPPTPLPTTAPTTMPTPPKAVPLPGSASSKAVPSVPKTATPTMANGTLLYVLINGLNIRTKPELKAKSLGKLKLNDQVFFMNEVTEAAQTVRLQDKTEVSKPWFKIKTKRGTVGWVHGSGVDFYKRKPQDGL